MLNGGFSYWNIDLSVLPSVGRSYVEILNEQMPEGHIVNLRPDFFAGKY
jgi:hypothetical protein